MRGLADSRFEVRFSCGRALSRIYGTNYEIQPLPQQVYAAAQREIATAKRLLEMPRVLDKYDDRPPAIPPDSTAKFSWISSDIRLEHIFRLLSLSLPPEPLHAAFQALHTDDSYLRGTALEYLESILPSGIRETLVQFLESTALLVGAGRPGDRPAVEDSESRHQIRLKLTLAMGASQQRGP
jgi:hypothetical protein